MQFPVVTIISFLAGRKWYFKNRNLFDFETNASTYSNIEVVDEYNGKIDQNFTITLLNVVDNADRDGTEDYYDSDDDNDGFTDEEESAYPSDPLDPQSVANTPPHHIGAPESISVTENVPLVYSGGRVC